MSNCTRRNTVLGAILAASLLAAFPGASFAKRTGSGSYAFDAAKHVSWDNSKHVTFKFVNNIDRPIYVKTGSHTCMSDPISTARVEPLQSYKSKVKFYWNSGGCALLGRMPEGQAPWPITANTINAELDIATKTSIDVDGSYCGGYFSLWGSDLQGHVKKVSFFQGAGDTRCSVSYSDNADEVTITANPK